MCSDNIRRTYPGLNLGDIENCVVQKERDIFDRARCDGPNKSICTPEGEQCTECHSFQVALACLEAVCDRYPKGTPERADCDRRMASIIARTYIDMFEWCQACKNEKPRGVCPKVR